MKNKTMNKQKNKPNKSLLKSNSNEKKAWPLNSIKFQSLERSLQMLFMTL